MNRRVKACCQIPTGPYVLAGSVRLAAIADYSLKPHAALHSVVTTVEMHLRTPAGQRCLCALLTLQHCSCNCRVCWHECITVTRELTINDHLLQWTQPDNFIAMVAAGVFD